MNSMKKIGKFDVIEMLGRGAMGVVYKGYDPFLDRHVAIKVMTAHLEMDTELRERFFREAQAAGSLQHPNIITVFELGESDGHPYIAMELVPGRDLDDIIKGRESLTVVEKVDLIEQVCRGLAYAHDRGIIHRDVKPANIRVSQMGQAKIMDFGVARLVTSELTTTGSLIGTPYYMAPEVVEGTAVDARADIFSVGASFYELLSYTRPFEGESLQSVFQKILHSDPAPLREMGLDMPPLVQKVLDKSLAKAPADRYESMGDMLTDLMKFWETVPSPGQARAAASTALGRAASGARDAARRKTSRRRKALIGAVAVFVLAVAGTAVWRTLDMSAAGGEQAAMPNEQVVAQNDGGPDRGSEPAALLDTAEQTEPEARAGTSGDRSDVGRTTSTRDAQPAARERTEERTTPRRTEPPTRPAGPPQSYGAALESARDARERALEAGAEEFGVNAFGRGEGYMDSGRRAAENGDYDQAELELERARRSFVDARGSAVSVWVERVDSARNEVSALRSQADQGASAFQRGEQRWQRADDAENLGNYEEALDHLQKAAAAYRAAEPEPEPVEPTASEVADAALAELRDAIEREDLDALRRIWVSLSASEARGFQALFDGASDIEVTFEVRSLNAADDRIRVDVRTTYDYFNESERKRDQQSFSLELDLGRRDDRWVIVGSRN